MRREITKWFSPNLNKEMEIVSYGDYGFALLMFPTAAADYLEYERFQLIDAIKPFIESGKCKVYSINSINSESWLNDEMHPYDKAIRHQQFNKYVVEEVVPFIYKDCNGVVPIYTTGASLGAFHAVNTFLRRPDLFAGTIGMSGSYDLTDYAKNYFDENMYFNSPMHYMPNLEDNEILEQMRNGKKIYLVSGRGNYEKPEASTDLSNVLNSKSIPNEVDLWGYDVPHDWPTWRKMLPYYLEAKL
ncbi:MAG TPA: esterase [Bacteroidetes bacterium]|nr:esterase family protein [Ignavibacteria bacterium]HCA42068.1 esterase [Bacteroidota bacterium]HCN37764.1 esterase [Bacteroidota bacterium]